MLTDAPGEDGVRAEVIIIILFSAYNPIIVLDTK